MSWKQNPIMEWRDTRPTVNGVANPFYNTWVKISDHNRSPLDISVERIETKSRMANGSMRIYVVAKKRTFSCSWENLPDKDNGFLVNGQPGNWMEEFHDTQNGPFRMRIRSGDDIGLPTTNPALEEYLVVFSDFSKEVVKRGAGFDLLSVSLSLEEV